MLSIVVLLFDGISLPAYFHCVISKLGAEDFLYRKDRQKGLYIDPAEYMLKPPADSLACDTENLVYLFAIGSLQYHPGRIGRF